MHAWLHENRHEMNQIETQRNTINFKNEERGVAKKRRKSAATSEKQPTPK
jgi:hypothetical protein